MWKVAAARDGAAAPSEYLHALEMVVGEFGMKGWP